MDTVCIAMGQIRSITPLKRLIFESGRTQRDIAAEVGVSEWTLSRIVNGLHTTERMQAAISDALGRTVEEVFPAEREAA